MLEPMWLFFIDLEARAIDIERAGDTENIGLIGMKIIIGNTTGMNTIYECFVSIYK